MAIAVVFVAQIAFSAATGFDPVQYARWIPGTLGLRLDSVLRGWLWQPLTYMFVHSADGFGHVLVNCLVLYLFGAQLEGTIGRNAFLKVFFGSGLAGAFAVLVAQGVTASLVPGAVGHTVLGASGATSGLVAAYCWLHWDRWLHLFFVRLKGWHLLAALVVIDVVRALGPSPIAVECHLGGTAFGLLWISGWIDPRTAWSALRLKFLKRRLRALEGGRAESGSDYLN